MAAVAQLGVDKAVPKRILDLMNVEGLTRENVASHLCVGFVFEANLCTDFRNFMIFLLFFFFDYIHVPVS